MYVYIVSWEVAKETARLEATGAVSPFSLWPRSLTASLTVRCSFCHATGNTWNTAHTGNTGGTGALGAVGALGALRVAPVAHLLRISFCAVPHDRAICDERAQPLHTCTHMYFSWG